MKFLFFLRQFCKDYPKYFLGTCLTLLIISGGGVYAATSYDVGNEAQMFLDASISTTATTIVLSSPQVNGANFVYSTTTGAILRIRSGFFREDIYVPTATVNATTNKVTLNNVVRNLCPQAGPNYSIITCGAGRNWGKGAIVELTVDKNLLNLKANIDRKNTFTAVQSFSGALSISAPITISGTTSYVRMPLLTTAQRTAITCTNGMMVYDTDIGAMYQCVGAVWSTFATGTTANATTTTSGKTELATVTDIMNHVISGDSAAPLSINMDNVTRTSTGTTQANKISALGTNGFLSGSLLGTGTRSASTVLKGNQTFGPVSASGYTLIVDKNISATTGNLNSTSWAAIDNTNLTAAPVVSVGDTIDCTFRAVIQRNNGNVGKALVDFQVGNNPISPFGSGAIAVKIDGTISIGYNVGFTYKFQTQTGGALTIKPIYRVFVTGGNDIQFVGNTSYQCTKAH